MRHLTLNVCCLLAATASCGSGRAGELNAPANRLTFGPRVGFNVKAGFSTSLTNPATDPGPATGGGLNRDYDDGYVRLDSSGNAGGKTWYWGYDEAAQVDLVGDTIRMHAVTGGGEASINDITADPYVGGELTYTRYLFEWGRANWGIELGGSFMPVEVKDSSNLSTLLSSVSDAFSLGGIVPPPAPYAGAFQGPGVVIGDTPVRSSLQQQATFSGDRKIETTAFGIRFGPSVDIPMGKPLSLQISGGLHVLYADSDFSYTESMSLNGGAPGAPQSGSSSEQDWIFGAYVRGQVLCMVSSSLGIFANVEYLMTDEIELSAGANRATLDFGNSFGCAAGLAWSF